MLRAALCSEMDADEWQEKKAPDWIEILPTGPIIKGQDGRTFTLSNPESVVKEFEASKLTMVVDYEHSTELKGAKGEPAPAAGWIKELKVESNNSIWGRVEWTEAAEKAINKKQYRYLSPVFHHKKSGEIIKLSSVGLTNKPNLVMTALNKQESSIATSFNFESEDWQEVAKALNVESINNADDVLQALNQQRIEQANSKYTEAVEELIEGAYIAPCERKFYLAACRASGYEEAMKSIDFIKSSKPAFGCLKEHVIKSSPQKEQSKLSHTQKAVCREIGVEEEQFSSFIESRSSQSN